MGEKKGVVKKGTEGRTRPAGKTRVLLDPSDSPKVTRSKKQNNERPPGAKKKKRQRGKKLPAQRSNKTQVKKDRN